MSKRALAAGFVALVALAGCAHRTLPGPVVYKTVTVAPKAAPSPSTSNVAAIASSTAPAGVMHALPVPCDDQLSLGTLINALGHPIAGKTAFVVGLPDATTGRLSYLDCRYGIKNSTTGIEIGVNLYRTAEKAAARVKPTIADFESHGATQSPATVADLPAHMLSGATGVGYGPSVVVADGQRTIVITLRQGADNGSDELLRLALLAVQRTSGA